MNMVTSNVPGPATPLYLGNAPMDATHPAPFRSKGLGLNITCVSTAGQRSIGVPGSRDSWPQRQRVAVHTGEALEKRKTALTSKAKAV